MLRSFLNRSRFLVATLTSLTTATNAFAVNSNSSIQSDDPVQFVDPLIGTGKEAGVSYGTACGNVFPGAALNGKPINRTYITRNEIIEGGTLELVMGEKPNINWGSNILLQDGSRISVIRRRGTLHVP
jgi:hypothetical protein